MKLQEIFDQLSVGEFSQLSIGGLDQGVIDEGNYAKVLPFVDLALMALFRRFSLRTGRLVLQLQEGQDEYRLASPFAVSAVKSKEPVRYIMDSPGNPFLDDLLKVERVLRADGTELPLNNESRCDSVSTPSSTRLLVPADLPRQALTLVYRASHPKLAGGTGFVNPLRTEVELPDSHLDALLLHIASRAQTPLGAGQSEGMAGTNYYARFEAACLELENKGLQVDQGSSNNRLRRNGWV